MQYITIYRISLFNCHRYSCMSSPEWSPCPLLAPLQSHWQKGSILCKFEKCYKGLLNCKWQPTFFQQQFHDKNECGGQITRCSQYFGKQSRGCVEFIKIKNHTLTNVLMDGAHFFEGLLRKCGQGATRCEHLDHMALFSGFSKQQDRFISCCLKLFEL